jgi:peptidoglycan hydrolase CwlO-like protein
MFKQKTILNRIRVSSRILAVSVLICVTLVAQVINHGFTVKAEASCSSIADCQQQISNNNNAVAALQDQATSYQDAIDSLNGKINQVQAIINANVAEQTDLQNRMDQAQAQLDQQKKTLGENIKAMYLEGDTSTIEILASSNNLSQYVDRQTYRNSVSDKIKTTLQTISTLQAQLKVQQQQLESLINSEETQKSQLTDTQYQKQQLLGYNQSQQDSFNAQTAQNQTKLSALIAAQRRANSSVSSGGYYFIHFPGTITADPLNGNYSYANWPFSMSLGGCTSDGPDAWGYCTRQCVSYVAWAVQYSGRAAPIGWGNAADWVGAARAAGIPFDAYPEAGDVAVSTAGTWGHVMYVENVSGNRMYVSEYNNFLTGQFYTEWRSF